MSLQRSACCRCAASNCCPGFVSSQYFMSIKCHMCSAHAAGLHSVGGVALRGRLLWSSVWGCVCCVTHDGVSRGRRRRRSGFGYIGSNLQIIQLYSIRTAGGEPTSL
eukprot:876435-Pelagomonas_calceolata.AAC.1